MECRGCKNQSATRLKTVYKSSGIEETCDQCKPAAYNGALLPDVWYGYGSGEHCEENIAYPRGHEKEGQPIPFSSKKGKAEAMKLSGVQERGDRKHGMRIDNTKRRIYG
jgi:hypothetical protein